MSRANPGLGPIPDRPNRPLVVKCGYEGTTRRITFPSASTCRFDSLRSRVEECFFLSASPFYLTYFDDDGEDFSIRCEEDLTEAISYFVSGDDEASASVYSGHSTGRMALGPGPSTQKISIRVEVLVEYDGPSLSDTSSILSLSTGYVDGEGASVGGSGESSWRSSGYSESLRSGGSSYRSSFANGAAINDEGSSTTTRSRRFPHDHNQDVTRSMESLGLSTSPDSFGFNESPDDPFNPPMQQSSSSNGRTRTRPSPRPSRQSSGHTMQPLPRQPLTGPESDPAPSLLTDSDLGSRWLREQTKLATTRRIVHPRPGSSRRYDSDEDSLGSDDESLGDLALVRDARGKFYYSYQNADDISLSSTNECNDDLSGPSNRTSTTGSPDRTASPTFLPVDGPHLHEIPRLVEPAGPPVLAPDCSACGIRLDYMRYVCQTCGEGDMWKEDAPDKAAFIPPKVPSESSMSDGSEETELAGMNSAGSQTVYEVDPSRVRSSSMSTSASRGSGTRSVHNISGNGLDLTRDETDSPLGSSGLPRGYELCVGCIELHGIVHSKAAAKEAKANLSSTELRRRRGAGELRHTFREKIWSVEGWKDVEYSEDSRCTICQSRLYSNRYKCVSCPKFDMCRSCYQKVEEIHPAHVFLSLPDKALPPVEAQRSVSSRDGSAVEAAPRPIRHPGAFCHNCLQDIVGPRFHCAVCPSWDLCIQCEGVAGVGDGAGHTADHIMMKIPLPLATNEVEAVSRRARDRWFQQDSNAVAAAVSAPRAPASSRSSSPTNDTVYAGGTQRNGHSPVPPPPVVTGNVTNRDALDHGLRCNNCNEWIMGRRYQCANCPSNPEGYNLCSICELRSYRVHDPRHVFFRFDRPAHFPLRSDRAFLPLMYRSRVGEIPSGTIVNPRDPVAYLKHVLHRETLCDIHSDQIRGIWLRCAHCAAGFDICQEAEQIADHDATHVFVVFKARVDMGVFRQVADLAAAHSKPLLRERVYLE